LDWKDIFELGAAHNFVTRILPETATVGQGDDNGGSQ